MNAGYRLNANFGRRGRDMGSPSAPIGRTENPPRGVIHLVGFWGLGGLLLAIIAAIFWTSTDIAKPNAEAARAERRVSEIVNQPVAHLPRSGPVTLFSPGWFHAGAVKPDFDNVDIRATQEFPYQGHVASDVNPSEMFDGSELEFNAMTKYFYADRTLPKKRLSGAEMIEINGLYRAIGRSEDAAGSRWWTIAGLVVVGFFLASAWVLLIRQMRRLPAG